MVLINDGKSSRSCLKITAASRSEEHTSEPQSRLHLVCRLLLEKKKKKESKQKSLTHPIHHLYSPARHLSRCCLLTAQMIWQDLSFGLVSSERSVLSSAS